MFFCCLFACYIMNLDILYSVVIICMIWRKTFLLHFPVVCFCLAFDSLFISSSGVSSVGTDIVPVFATEGDSVTLHTDVKTNDQEKIVWFFNDIRIAQITGDLRKICTDVQCNAGTERFRDRLKLDHQTGSLTIRDITNTDSGLYKLKIIRRSSDNGKIFNVSLHGESFNKCLIYLIRLYMFQV